MDTADIVSIKTCCYSDMHDLQLTCYSTQNRRLSANGRHSPSVGKVRTPNARKLTCFLSVVKRECPLRGSFRVAPLHGGRRWRCKPRHGRTLHHPGHRPSMGLWGLAAIGMRSRSRLARSGIRSAIPRRAMAGSGCSITISTGYRAYGDFYITRRRRYVQAQ